MFLRRFRLSLLILALVLSLTPGISARASGSFQTDTAAAQAQQMLAKMTPEERVGQLFLVSFKGSTANADSQIYDLIVHHHIGGVMLLAGNDNFVDAPNTTSAAYALIAQLQNAEWQASQYSPTSTSVGIASTTPTPFPTATPVPSNYIPLFVGIAQNGDGYPNDQILSGLTQLPSQMAIGATWDPDLAKQVGSVAGQELSALGFNFFIGPSLDVLDSPESTLGNGLNTSIFGGDPYWVGTLGSAYISGLHSGSNGRMVVIADHFPGSGSSDRPSGEESAAVQKGLDELKKVELAPFFAVTGNAQDAQSTTDGLLVSHNRYLGFQGNIQSTTRPISFDPQALAQILTLPALSSWRQAGGLMVSDDLGSPAVRNFYDPSGKSFLARLVARDAFLAGNDLLYMGNIVSTDAPDNYSALIQTFDFFTQKYRQDSAFAKRVDDAVTRILTIKYHLYSYFSPYMVIPPNFELDLLNQPQSQAVTSEVARQSATLVSPDSLTLETVLPTPPGVRDQLVFLTDTRSEGQCSTCSPEPMLAEAALQNVILRLYSLPAGGQIMSGRMISYPIDLLSGILTGGAGNQDLENSLNQANWVIINMLDAEPDQPQTVLLHRFLSERQDLLRDKHVIVFAFNAPFFLDATDISKLTAYYCLYGKSASFVEVAARLLFRELTPVGILPVSVPAIGYDLSSATTPDPKQVISLSHETLSAATPSTGTKSVEPTSTPSFSVGETASIQTGIIVDHNGHPVPDGTSVQFTLTMSGTGGVVQQIDSVTSHGVASALFNIAQAGLLEIRATSNPAMTSDVLQLDVTKGGVSVTIATPTAVSIPTSTPVVVITPTPEPLTPLQKGSPGLGGWFAMVLVLSGFGFLVFWLGDRFITRRWGVRGSICVVLGGILSYSYLAVHLPGAASFLEKNGWTGIIGMVLLGALLGGAGAVAWFFMVRESKKRPN